MIAYDLGSPRQDVDPAKNKSISIAIFMDGTLNNAYNTEARETYKARYRAIKSEDKSKYTGKARAYLDYKENNDEGKYEGSYEGDYTNVNKLYQGYVRKDNLQYKAYIEGIGTIYNEEKEKEYDRYGKDEMMEGPAFGRGINGIRGKVYKACQKAVSFCNEDTKRITIDVYGFSRGAAAARNFVYEIFRDQGIDIRIKESLVYNNTIDAWGGPLLQGYVNVEKNQTKREQIALNYTATCDTVKKGGFFGYLLNLKGIEISNLSIQIRFVGLFDTVASYNPESIITSFERFIKRLHLEAVEVKAKRIVHLTSQDEHRENFSLTPVGSSKLATEISLPGVHSDIGGGYRDNITEKKEVSLEGVGTEDLEKRKQWLEEQCFFGTRSKYPKNRLYIEKQKFGNNILKSEREAISSKYSLIPLEIMTKFMEKEISADVFRTSLLINYLTIPDTDQHPSFEKAKQVLVDKLTEHTNLWKNSPITGFSVTNDWKGNYMGYLSYCMNILMQQVANGEVAQVSVEDALAYARKSLIRSTFYGKAKMRFKNGTDILKETKYYDVSNPNRDIENKIKETKEYKSVLMIGALPADVIKMLDVLSERMIEQIALRVLRLRYLHWSADYEGTIVSKSPISANEPVPHPRDPRQNGKRYIIHADGTKK